ncbi:hydroxyethylthiazole kinase 1 [Spirochaetia bacterium]|nr:hydroxyethylthiazole kinase 1 [Spirochaetia bacterium]
MAKIENEMIANAAKIIDAVRTQNPLVHCITNVVTVNDCANILLAFGASPAMVDVFDEAYEFARISSALYINLGTYNREQETAAVQAVLGAKAAGIPMVIDPVGCAAIPKRIGILDHLYHVGGIDIIKGNMGEIMALGGYKADVKGVDSNGDIAGIEEAARFLAKQYHCTVAATGKADVVTDGERLVRVHNGVELLTKITGAGCMAGALCAAAAGAAKAVGADMVTAALAGLMCMGIAGEQAAEKTKLPGSYRTVLMDSIYTVTGHTILEQGRLQC